MTNDDLSSYLDQRPEQIKQAKERGIKVIGVLPGNYVPEELIYASGAIPVCLIHGGLPHAPDAALNRMPDIMCPFSRAQVGERILGKIPYYNIMDMLIAPITCQHIKKIAEIWEYDGDIDIFKLGIPHRYDEDFALEYYIERLRALKARLESVTGNEVTREKLLDAIHLYNRMRELFRNISLLRKLDVPPVSSVEFIKLNHASFYADPSFMVDYLSQTYNGLENRLKRGDVNKVRLLLVAPNVAYDDLELFKLIESAGAEVVVEEICEGTRYYWDDIGMDGDPVVSLAKGYLRDRLPCAFMRNSAKRRLDFSLELIRDFKVSGVIWYELIGCETYDSESYFFEKKLAELGVPMLTLESDYGTSDLGQMRVRIEAFIEQIEEE